MNTTQKYATNIHGTDPQYLVEKITRMKIYDCLFWKEHCFALTAELLIDKAIKLRYIGGVYGGLKKPTPFICLILKMLQIQPSKDIILELIKQSDEKYVRILSAFYLRLTGNAYEIYTILEPLFQDFRRLRIRSSDGSFSLKCMDEIIDVLLNENYSMDISLPQLQNRIHLENNGRLEIRKYYVGNENNENTNGKKQKKKNADNDHSRNTNKNVKKAKIQRK